MMKNFKVIIIAILCFVIMACCLTSCSKKTYKINFISFGETIATEKLKGTGDVNVPEINRDGYNFIGWYLDEDVWQIPFSSNYFSEKAIDKNYVVYARWKQIEYVNYTFEPLNGEDNFTEKYLKGVKANLPVLTRTDYSFLGWCTTEKLNSFYSSESPTERDTVLYAKWLAYNTAQFGNCTVTIDYGDATDDFQKHYYVPYGEKVVLSQPFRLGYEFVNYYTDADMQHVYNPNMLLTTDFTLYVEWLHIESTFTVAFEENGGNIISDYTYVFYNAKVSSCVCERDGYDFVGWYKDNTLLEAFDFDNDRIYGNTVLYAKWKEKEIDPLLRNTLLITFICNGGTDYGNRRYNYVIGNYELPTPTKSNNDFGGWYIDEFLTTPYVYDATRTNDFTVYAKWNEILQYSGFKVRVSKIDGVDGVCVENYTGNETFVSIPETVNDKNVVEISNDTFKNNFNIQNVIIPQYVLKIGASAFENCTALEEVTFYCQNLRDIGGNAFYQTKLPINLTFNDKLEQIGASAFEGTDIKALTLGGNTTIGNNAFKDCDSLTVVTANALTVTGNSSFESCDKLSELNLENCITVSGNTFANCKILSTVNMNNCKYIKGSAFENCIMLSEMNFPFVENIETNAFQYSGISSMVLPRIVSISSNAFKNCNRLTTVNLGTSLDSLDEFRGNAFYACKKVNITIDTENENYASHNGSVYTKDMQKLVVGGGAETEDGYKYEYTVMDNLENIEATSLFSLIEISTLNICESLRYSDNIVASFIMLGSIETFTVADGNTDFSVGTDGCLYNENMIIRYTVGAMATSYTFLATTDAIGMGAFNGAKNLTEITLNDTITEISMMAFFGCTNLALLNNIDNIESIGEMAFEETKLNNDGSPKEA